MQLTRKEIIGISVITVLTCLWLSVSSNVSLGNRVLPTDLGPNEIMVEASSMQKLLLDMTTIVSTADGNIINILGGKNADTRIVCQIPRENYQTVLNTVQDTLHVTAVNVTYQEAIPLDVLKAKQTILQQQKEQYERFATATNYSSNLLDAYNQLMEITNELDEVTKQISNLEQQNKYIEVTIWLHEEAKPIGYYWDLILPIILPFMCVILGVLLIVLIFVVIYALLRWNRNRKYNELVRRSITPLTVETVRRKVHNVTEEEG